MKKTILLALFTPLALCASAQTEDWSGITIIENTYAQKISSNGQYIVGFSDEGGTVVYNRLTNDAAYYPYMDYGRGHVVSDNGWVVGCQMIEEDGTNRAYIVADGQGFVPPVFQKYPTSNVHSITPDGSRICGVVGNPGNGATNFPFYCDIAADGSLGEIQILPTPDKDFFGYHPQYCSATWISADGKTIAGQVIDSRGFVVYPLLYTQQEDGQWEYSCPSENLFNPEKLPLPEPVGDMEDLFPDAPYPELKNFMDPSQYLAWQAAGEPYDEEELSQFMTKEQMEAYDEALFKYWDAQEKYNELFDAYMNQYWAIYDSSVFFTRNAMALSPDGKWLTSSAAIDEVVSIYDVNSYYVPYTCNLETGEWSKFGVEHVNYHTNQVFNNGMTVVNVISDGLSPASTYLYFPENEEFMSLTNYLEGVNPQYVEWIKHYLTGDVITGGDYDNPEYEEDVTFTGQASFSDDLSVIAGGADGFVLNLGMYITYIFDGADTGVEMLKADVAKDGVYNVYSLQGVRVLSTKNMNDLNGLAKGLYIINGKKVLVK